MHDARGANHSAHRNSQDRGVAFGRVGARLSTSGSSGAAPRLTELGWAGAKLAPPPHEQVTSPPPDEGIGEATASPPSSGGVVSAAVGSARGTGRADGISLSTAGSVELYISRLKNIVSEDQLEPTVQAIRRQLATTIGPTPQDQLEGLIYLAAWLNVQLIHGQKSQHDFWQPNSVARTDEFSSPKLLRPR